MAAHERDDDLLRHDSVPTHRVPEELGRDLVEGVAEPPFAGTPETVSAPLPQDDPAAYDPHFEGDAQHRSPVAPPTTGQPRPQGAYPAPQAGYAPETYREPANPRGAYVREPVPHRTQAAINRMDEDDFESSIDYSHESGYTTRRGSAFSGSGYRRSRADEQRFKKDLKYGQYLEVPKGRRDLFASQRQQRTRIVAIVLALVAVLLVVALVLWLVLR